MDLPHFKCHKEVMAAKIVEINRIGDGNLFELKLVIGKAHTVKVVSMDWVGSKDAEVGGYYVLYDDGYTSYSPAKAFEAGYTSMANEFKNYRKKGLQQMRPYVSGEDLTGISVNKEDTPEVGGMIAVNAKNAEDKWYVGKAFFEENYELVE